MKRLIIERTLLGLLTLFVVSILIFAGTEVLPGDVATAVLGPEATPAAVKALRTSLGLDAPAALRYLRWLGNTVQGDFGKALANGVPVSVQLLPRLFNTFSLSLFAALLTIPGSIAIGILAVASRSALLNRTIAILGLASLSIPEFFLAYLLIMLFAVKLGWLPSLAAITPDSPWSERFLVMILPAVTMTLGIASHLMRMTTAAIEEVMSALFIEMALLKGIPYSRVVVRHALPNAWPPIIGIVGITLASLIVSVVVVEVVFVYPGIGQYLVDAVGVHDVPVVQACGLIFAATYVVINAVADVLAIALTPRMRWPK